MDSNDSKGAQFPDYTFLGNISQYITILTGSSHAEDVALANSKCTEHGHRPSPCVFVFQVQIPCRTIAEGTERLESKDCLRWMPMMLPPLTSNLAAPMHEQGNRNSLKLTI